MRTALDTNILSLFCSGGPLTAAIASQLSKARTEGALVVCGPVFVELSAIPAGSPERVEKLLGEMISAWEKMSGDWPLKVTESATASP